MKPIYLYQMEREELVQRSRVLNRERHELDEELAREHAKFKKGDVVVDREGYSHTVRRVKVTQIGFRYLMQGERVHPGIQEDALQLHVPKVQRYQVTEGFNGSLEVRNLNGLSNDYVHEYIVPKATIKFIEGDTTVFLDEGQIGSMKNVTFELPYYFYTDKYLKEVN
jgi:hypothetical protein